MKLLTLLALLPSLASAAQSVTLAWNANPETNLAGYRVYYGTNSTAYTDRVQVAASETRATVTNLTQSVTYYFAVTAFTSDALESDYSDEVAYLVPPPRKTLTITVRLEEACELTGPWDQLTNTFKIVLPEDGRFYRARMEVTR